jgi:hypothetical protein
MKRCFLLFFILFIGLSVSNCTTFKERQLKEVEETYQKNLSRSDFTKPHQATIAPLRYPTPAIPRYYRYEMYKNLSHFLKKRDEKHLGHFSYWFKRWKGTFPEEYQTSLDQVYGFSEYQVALKNNRWERDGNWFEDFDLKSEAGLLGFVSGRALSLLKVPGWQQKVQKGASSLELLAQLFKPERESIDHKIQNKIFDASLRFMEKNDPKGYLDQAVANLANPKKFRLVLPAAFNDSYRIELFEKWNLFELSGAIEKYQVFFNFNDIKDVTLFFQRDDVIKKDQKVHLPVDHPTVIIQSKQNACSKKDSIILVVDEANIEFTEKQIWRKGSSQKIPGELLKRKSGQWFCALASRHQS